MRNVARMLNGGTNINMENKENTLNDDRSNENAVEWLSGQKIISVTFSQRKFINKARKLAEQYPDDVQIIAENEDGSIFLHAPLSYFKFGRPRQITDEQRAAAGERMKKYQDSKVNA